jgi:regulator of protease activity HflC (stomatin/prohibitin superfamily)
MGFITSLITTLIGILLYANSGKMNSDRTQFIIKSIGGLIILLGGFSTISATVAVIPAGNVGVLDTFGKVSKTLNPGVHLINPFGKVVIFSTRLKNVQEAIESTSQEGLEFNINVSLQYRLEPEKADKIYQTIGKDDAQIVIPRFRSIVREITASYPAEAIYSTKRQEVANQMKQRITQQLQPLGFIVEEALLREIKLPEKLSNAIQDKLTAEQQNQQMTFVLQKEKKEADRKRIEAQGVADSQKIISQGLNPNVLQLRTIEATEKLATSGNSKIIIMGNSNGGTLPIINLGDGKANK